MTTPPRPSRRARWAAPLAVAGLVAGGAYEGRTHPANAMLSLAGGPVGSTDPQVNPAWRLEPGQQTERRVGFTVPRDATLTRLHIAVPLHQPAPTAEWNL